MRAIKEKGMHVDRGQGLQELLKKKMCTGTSWVQNHEYCVEWWRSSREAGEHQPQERLGSDRPIIL